MSAWQRARYAPPRLVADWRAREPAPPGYFVCVHALDRSTAQSPACGAVLPVGSVRLGFGAVTCPRCRETRP